MKKMNGSGNYLKNQVRKKLAQAAVCLLLFLFIFSVSSLEALLTFSFGVLEAVGFVFSLVMLVGFYYFLRQYRIYGAGWAGEKEVVKLLKNKLSDDYILLNDLYLHGGGGDIDHIVLAPSGVFVLETKNWSGEITCNGDEWRRSGRGDYKGSPSRQVKRNVATIRDIVDSVPVLRSLGVWVEGIVVFTNKHATLHINNPTVMIVKLAQLSSQIENHQSQVRYSPLQLEAIGKEILKRKR
jgi:hypothetical protein